MRIDYHDLSDKAFEDLVICICSEILGPGVSPFCTGPDGGRDGRFEGTASHLPNDKQPYRGKFVLQSKHTENPIAKFSDADFSSDAESSVLSQEMQSIKNLVDAGELDIYLLFSNRKISGLVEAPIVERIKRETGVKSVELFGIERMDFLLKRFSRALETFGHIPQHLPILVTADALAEVILAISTNAKSFSSAFKLEDLHRVKFRNKNNINGLSDDFAKFIRREYLPDFEDVKKFLAKPENETILEHYVSAAIEFQEQITIHRKQYANFDDVLVRIASLLIVRDGDLRSNKRLTKLVIYYMYWNCDIGEKDESDVET